MEEWRYSTTILDLGTIWSSVVSFTPRQLYLRERAPGTHWIGGWVGPTARLDVMEKRKYLVPAGNRIPAVQAVAILTELSLLLKIYY
jgi:hypothetical protein